MKSEAEAEDGANEERWKTWGETDVVMLIVMRMLMAGAGEAEAVLMGDVVVFAVVVVAMRVEAPRPYPRSYSM